MDSVGGERGGLVGVRARDGADGEDEDEDECEEGGAWETAVSRRDQGRRRRRQVESSAAAGEREKAGVIACLCAGGNGWRKG